MTTTPVPQPDDATFADLNPAEVEWVKINLDWLAETGWDGEAETLELILDRMFAAWSAADELARPDPNEMVNACGIGLGDVVNRTHGLRWQVYTDSEDSSLVCHDAAAALTLFPVQTVARHWEAGDTGWLAAFTDTVALKIEEVRAQASTARD